MKIQQKYLVPWIVVSCFLLALVVMWLHRSVFLQPFDYQYVRNFYDHSHWTVALSSRKMGDALLYQIASYELVSNDSFTEINPEAPPFGKYLMGWSIVLVKNALWINFPLYLLVLLFSYLITRRVFDNKKQQALALFLIGWQPLVWQQLYQSMLDLGQLAWLLGWTWSLIELTEQKKKSHQIIFTLLAGIFFGLFISTKIAIFAAPLILILGIWFLLKKKFIYFLFSGIIAGLVYGMNYLPYLLSTNLTATIDLQKWIVNYWLSSHSRAVPGITLLTITTGVYLGHWQESSWTWLNTWHPSWLIGTLGFIWLTVRKKIKVQKLSSPLQLIVIMLATLIISLTIVPLFPRYLITIVPFVAITTVWTIGYLKKRDKYIIWLLITWTIGQTLVLLPPNLKEDTKEIERVAEVPAYQEMWYYLDDDLKNTTSRNEFWEITQLAITNAQIKKIDWDISLPKYYFDWQKNVPVKVDIHYTTDIGDFDYSYSTLMQRRNGRWQLVWDWNLIFPDWDPSKQINANFNVKKGQILDTAGIVLIEDGDVSAVAVTPGQIVDELKMNDQIEILTGITKPNQELLYKIGHLPNQTVLIGPLLPQSHVDDIQNLDPGISIQTIQGRIYHPDVISHPDLLARLIEMDKNNPSIYWGILSIIDPNNLDWEEVLINKPEKNVANLETDIQLNSAAKK